MVKMPPEKKNKKYVELLNQIYGVIDPKNPLYRGFDKSTEDHDKIMEATCDKAKDVLDKLFYADLIVNYLEVMPGNDGTLDFEYYVDVDNNIDLIIEVDNNGNPVELMCWMISHPSIQNQRHAETRNDIAFVEEVERKIRAFIEEFPESKVKGQN